MTLRGDLLAALARGVEADSVIAVKAALRKLDPLLGMIARRRLRKLQALTNRTTIDDDPTHRLRVAALLLSAPQRELEFDDRAAVQLAYAELGPQPGPPRRGPWFSLGALLTLALLVGAGLLVKRVLRPFDPRETDAGRLLGDGLGTFLIRTDNGASGNQLTQARETLTDLNAQRAYGPDTAAAVGELLDATGNLAAAQDPSGGVQESERFFNSANSLSSILRKRQLPYFVDADILRREEHTLPLLMSFYIERETEYEAAGVRVRAIDLWRLDAVRLRFGALGYTRPRTPAALVLLDQVESDLVRSVLPALAPGEPAELVDDETREENLPWVSTVERLAGEAVRKHYAALSADPHVVEVGKLLAQRRSLVRRWRATIAAGGHQLHVPERLIPERDYTTDLHLRVANQELYDWEELHSDLLSKQNYAAFLRLREPYVQAIERHEVEHRLDFARGFRPVPELLCHILGIENALDAPAGSLQERVSSEFSAYLAQLAEGPDSPVLELVVLSSILLNQHSAGGVYGYSTLALMRAIAVELGLDPEGIEGRTLRERTATLLLQMISNPAAELRAAAAHAYEKAYGEPVPHVVKKSVRENVAWRH